MDQIDLTEQQSQIVEMLLETGLYGVTREDVLERLISQKLLEFIEMSLLKVPLSLTLKR